MWKKSTVKIALLNQGMN